MSLALSGLISGASNISCSCSISSMMRSTSIRHNIQHGSSNRQTGHTSGGCPSSQSDLTPEVWGQTGRSPNFKAQLRRGPRFSNPKKLGIHARGSHVWQNSARHGAPSVVVTPEEAKTDGKLPTQAKSWLEWATCDLSGSFPTCLVTKLTARCDIRPCAQIQERRSSPKRKQCKQYRSTGSKSLWLKILPLSY